MRSPEQTDVFSASSPVWQREPFLHQCEMARWHWERDHSLDLSDVGTGKTAGVIAPLWRLFVGGAIQRALVICPNSIIDNWANELATNAPTLKVGILRGTKQKRVQLLDERADVFLINYEGVRVLFPQLAMKQFQAIICDEVHHIKGYRAEQTKLILRLGRQAHYRKGMTGTILTNSIQDLWSICEFIDPAIFRCNFWGYRNRYMFDKNAGKSWLNFPDWQPKPGAVEEIKQKIAPYAIRFEKKDVLKFLPPVLFEKRIVDLTEEQRRAYTELKRYFITELEGEELAALHILTRVNKLLQIASGFAYRDEEDTYRFKRNAKLEELKAVLEEIGDKRVVIWCAYREEVQFLTEQFSEGDSACIYGDTPPEMRQFVVDSFNQGKIKYLIANPACAGEGLTLLAPYAIYYSRGWKLGERLQSLGRHDRPGAEQFENITIIDLVARDTVDEQVMWALHRKEDLMQSINPKTFREWLR